MEVADQRHVDVHLVELLADIRHGGRRLRTVDGQAHQLRTGARQLLDLDGGADGVGRVGVGHRLHHDRRVAADPDLAVAVRDQHAAAVTPLRWSRWYGCLRCRHDDGSLLMLDDYLMLTREIVPPAIGGRASDAPPSVASTPPGLPTISRAGSWMSKVSVLPALNRRDTSDGLPGRRISTHESSFTFKTSAVPLAAAGAGVAAAGVASAAGALTAAASFGAGTEISGTDADCSGAASSPGLTSVVSSGAVAASAGLSAAATGAASLSARVNMADEIRPFL